MILVENIESYFGSIFCNKLRCGRLREHGSETVLVHQTDEAAGQLDAVQLESMFHLQLQPDSLQVWRLPGVCEVVGADMLESKFE
jgi:hypothetical protein